MAEIKNVAVIGLGLMGGSLALALRRRTEIYVSAYARRAETRKAALDGGVAHAVYEHLPEAVQGAQVVVICTPVGLIADMVVACAPGLGPGCVVTDVGSSKAEVVGKLDGFFPDGSNSFVGSHPIAGSERQGLESASPDLYADANVIVTVTTKTSPEALAMVEKLWRLVGARVSRLTPEEHDRILAATSHMPHLAAVVLAATVGRQDSKRLGGYCGTGFLDSTRIAEGDPAMWHDIIFSNRVAILAELQAFDHQLHELITALEKSDEKGVRQLLAAGRTRRRALKDGLAVIKPRSVE